MGVAGGVSFMVMVPGATFISLLTGFFRPPTFELFCVLVIILRILMMTPDIARGLWLKLGLA